MTRPVEKSKDVDCDHCGAIVTSPRNPATKKYEAECPGCEKQLQAE